MRPPEGAMAPAMPSSHDKAELEAVLSSEAFAKSPNLARLLEYICNKYFEGNANGLKEYNIGVEALGRPADFDPTTSSIVRVEVHRLREKLKKYYEHEGTSHPIMIALEVGHYIPQFVRREEVLLNAAPKEPAASDGVSNVNAAVFAHEPQGPQLDPGHQIIAKPLDVTMVGGSSTSYSVVLRLLRRREFPALIVGLLVVTVAVAVWKLAGLRPGKATVTVSSSPSGTTAGALREGEGVRILAGYFKDNYIDRKGNVWRGDRYFTGGWASDQPRQFIARTSDPTLYRASRQGEFSYDIPLRAGVYEFRLYFVETNFGPATYAGGGESSRVFSIDMNGKPLLPEFDPFREAGGNNVAHVCVFKDVTPAPDGYLHLRFRRFKDEPFVNALEVVPGIPGKLHPIRIVAQDNSYTDRTGRVWSPDCYFSGGRLITHKGPVAGTPDPDLYAGERFGNFSYAIPVASGKHTVTLRFAETYFGAENAGFGGVGSRVFDVYCNGVALLRNFDIFKEVGGANRAVDKTFRGLEPNAAGLLVLSFVPIKNYACVNAIEVVEE